MWGKNDKLYGLNAGLVAELYLRYLADPSSVDPSTRAYFDRVGNPFPEELEELVTQAELPTEIDVLKIVGAARLARLTREYGHMAAQLDPLGTPPPGDPELELDTHGLTEADLEKLPASVVGGPLAQTSRNALEAYRKLRDIYCGSIGYDFDQVQDSKERDWLRDMVESRRFAIGDDPEFDRKLLERLSEVETFERFLHRYFPGQKWFSIEGLDMLIPMLDEIISRAAESGVREVVIGIAHRGRLNVMAHILEQPYEKIIAEFKHGLEHTKGTSNTDVGVDSWTGDVKYHLGATLNLKTNLGCTIPITLVPNPSHLEHVNPVVEGRARAAQEDRSLPGPPRQDERASLAILIHGDAAFPGQGIVAETLNLSRLPGYRTGGTIHIIANNQLGFTTEPSEGRSTTYAGDLAKGFEIPTVHVNADDPHACILTARLAETYRETFRKDFMIDLIGYRRYGHNESDEPSFTQPLMYEKIRKHPTVREIFAQKLIQRGIVSTEEVQAFVSKVEGKLRRAMQAEVEDGRSPESEMELLEPEKDHFLQETKVSRELIAEINESLLSLPEGFEVHPKLWRTLARRRDALERGEIDWGHAETLAFATILMNGTPIRISGQDTERGTFSQRHMVLHDVKTGQRYIPLQAIPQARASFAIYNSPLSENAVLGFEYGYSTHAPETLVLWEAQYGDFVNGAQVMIDQFIVSGQAKWRQKSGLVLLLPHGYEGQGPEHSSARIERFLQLAANDNIRIVYPSNAAQYFHLLRRQAASLKSSPKPLVVFTPKSLLRHPLAMASVEDLVDGRFQKVIDDPRSDDIAPRVNRIILCSGKIYVDLVSSKEYREANHVAIARVEELYPFPAREILQVVSRYSAAKEVVWVQEEPRNMGAWNYIALRLRKILDPDINLGYIGRPDRASPAEGSVTLHNVQQSRIIKAAFGEAPDISISGIRETVRHGS
ncbi:2-oxoglutarate dehydrogenase, E1 subunit [Thermobaculum terrenum ATCC BAA-798]|uniref:oxoglutarate dehydrogenase (succinyl-transferring) n=1 Tax=Thermobaculum terrenum (strain ATCC BAA-798 / CCMEE 7001 / YNP1) TaxID=525904 RepID=D1CE99_THET1|nr:2-oxoglutarate dehydrogenase E1 component [Thermobaculum terrenum]ACZ41255.1 2-oxoglutarate dehydrogenase, E1 subunit [Thermobaculum terrenum ATCC BAA-798]